MCYGVNYAVFLKSSNNNKEVYILKQKKNIYIYIYHIALKGEHRGLCELEQNNRIIKIGKDHEDHLL